MKYTHNSSPRVLRVSCSFRHASAPINIHRRGPLPSFTPFSPLCRAPPVSSSSAAPDPAGIVAGASPERIHHRSVLRVLNSGEPPRGKLAAGNSGHRIRHYDVFNDSASDLGTNHGDPNLLRPSSLYSNQAGSFKGFRQGGGGTSAHPEKTSGAGQTEHQVEEVTKKSKARKRDSEAKGKWWPCTTTEMELKNLESEGFLQPGSWRSVPDELAPAPRDDEMVLTKALVERGFSFPPSDFFLEILKTYGLQPHNISPNSVLAISNHVALCEGHLRVTPEISLFQYFFSVKKIRQSGELATCGSITFMLRPGRVYPPTDRHESARYWSAGFFYLKDVSDPASEKKLPAFKNCPANELPSWTHCPHFSDSPQLIRAVRRICKLTEEGLSGKDLTLSWFTKRIQPLQHRDRLMFEYTGRDDPMRATKDNLSADALDKRIRVLIKISRELHVHLEALEENELGTLLRVPSTSNADPEAASEAEAPEASRPAKRKKPAPSSPRAKRAREVLSTAATRKLEAEKKRLSLINTSNRGQPASQHFFKPSGFIHLQAGSKDIINIDDLPEDPAHHGDSAKGTSSPIPPPDQPSSAFAGPTEEEKEQKAKLLQVTNATRVHLQPTPSFQKLTLAQRHAEVSAMLNKVWGKPDEEVRELADLEVSLKDFFAKHREVRQTTRKLHEDLRVHVLEQIAEIEGLRQNAENSQKAIQLLETRLQEETAKHSKFNELSAKIQVLEAENESLKEFVKTSASQEHKARKELSEKHARDLAELNEKLEKSQGRVISVISKNKGLEAEAEAIDKLIFPSLGFEWTKESNLTRTEAYDEARISIDKLIEACRGIATALSLKKAKTTVIDTMTKLMGLVPDFIKDWQKSSARGVASLVLATCKAHFPSLNLATVARGAPRDSDMGALLAETEGYEQLFVRRVDHSFWYNKHDLPEGFSDAEEEAGEPEYYGEGSGSSGEHSGESSGDGSKAGSGDSDDGSNYQQSEEEDSE
ncbi:hypothetical protein QYE76_011165 [Lolium multiflorum]|uniref:Transposase (putative) gypsy type domain-containing protein n=1 Tax=Lolium multiflorum TaxID=4521 RepID=A0AAD8TYM5_LOLMU|nr:hypothetical protein QYE76_011165 [Lolium multiflorum]